MVQYVVQIPPFFLSPFIFLIVFLSLRIFNDWIIFSSHEFRIIFNQTPVWYCSIWALKLNQYKSLPDQGNKSPKTCTNIQEKIFLFYNFFLHYNNLCSYAFVVVISQERDLHGRKDWVRYVNCSGSKFFQTDKWTMSKTKKLWLKEFDVYFWPIKHTEWNKWTDAILRAREISINDYQPKSVHCGLIGKREKKKKTVWTELQNFRPECELESYW